MNFIQDKGVVTRDEIVEGTKVKLFTVNNILMELSGANIIHRDVHGKISIRIREAYKNECSGEADQWKPYKATLKNLSRIV